MFSGIFVVDPVEFVAYILQNAVLIIGKGTPYLTSEVPLLSREYSPRKPTVRSFYPPLSISAPF